MLCYIILQFEVKRVRFLRIKFTPSPLCRGSTRFFPPRGHPTTVVSRWYLDYESIASKRVERKEYPLVLVERWREILYHNDDGLWAAPA